MTTIITKNGSGAPTAGQLSQGELAVDLTNKELYTKDSGGNVIKVGAQGGSTGTFTDLTATSSFTSPGIDDNATSTAITIDSNGDVITGDNLLIQNKAGGVGSEAEITFVNSDVLSGESGRASIVAERVADGSGGYDGSTLTFSTTNGGTTADLDPRVTVDSSGYVGIGTNTPSAILHCAETASGLTARFSNETNQTLDIGTVSGSGAAGSVYLDNPNSGNMQFRIGGSEAARVDSVGNVGIGTTPNAWRTTDSVLQLGSRASVVGLANDTHLSNNAYFDAGTTWRAQDTEQATNYYQSAGSHVWRYAGTTTAGAAISWTEAMRIDSSGNLLVGTDDGSFINGGGIKIANSQAARLKLCDTDTAGTGSSDGMELTQSGTAAYLFNNENAFMAFGTNATERMRLDSAGTMMVGKTSGSINPEGVLIYGNGEIYSTIASNESYVLYDTTNDLYRFRVSSAGQISATNTSISAISDASLKENIRDLDKGLDTINALKPRRFDWKNGDGNDIMGFIAQEVEEVMPELIDETQYNKDEIKKCLKMGDMVPSMVKAIQELSAQVNELKAEVAALKGA